MSQEYKLPSRINIMGQWVSIKYVENIPSDTSFVHGTFELDKNCITIRKANAQEMYRTLIHEIGHAMFAYSGMGEILGERKEEATCRLLEYFSNLFYLTESPRFLRLRQRQGED